MAFQVGSYLYLTTMEWYTAVKPPSPDAEIVVCYETTTVFAISAFQYLMLAAVFSVGPPYRRPFFTNIPFALALFILTGMVTTKNFSKVF